MYDGSPLINVISTCMYCTVYTVQDWFLVPWTAARIQITLGQPGCQTAGQLAAEESNWNVIVIPSCRKQESQKAVDKTAGMTAGRLSCSWAVK